MNFKENIQLSVDEALIIVDPNCFRPTEIELLIYDSTKAQEKLGREPKCGIKNLLDDTIKSDVKRFRKDFNLKEAWYKVLKQAE